MVHIYNGISLSHKRNEFKSVFSEGDEPRAVIQSEVSQKEKNKGCVLMHTHGILESGADEPICRAA